MHNEYFDFCFFLFSSKRSIDFGLGRGYSGTREANQRIGMSAATLPSGPGRKRRSLSLA